MYRWFFCLILVFVSTAYADICKKQISIDSILGVLYKPENLHGARGPTWLVQNPRYRTKKRRIEIRDTKCQLISSFGLFRTDFPYGARYYQKSGGSKHSAKQLRKLAARVGSTAILVEAPKGLWIRVENPLNRQGTIFAP